MNGEVVSPEQLVHDVRGMIAAVQYAAGQPPPYSINLPDSCQAMLDEPYGESGQTLREYLKTELAVTVTRWG